MKKWAALAMAIVALEALPGPTLTAAHIGALDMRRNWVPIGLTHAFIVAHLWGVIPHQVDPLCLLARRIGK